MRSVSRAPAPTKVSIAPSEARFKANTTRRSPDAPHHAASGQTGELYCTSCGAVHHRKHWTLDPDVVKQVRADPRAVATRCPGCEQAANKVYDGEVVLEGAFVSRHAQEIIGLIHHVEREMRTASNPLARLGELHWEGDRLTAYTVTPHLAERLGKAVRKAYQGKLLLQHPERERFVRVHWARED